MSERMGRDAEEYYSHSDFDYLRKRTLHLRAWTSTSPEWDHDHCEICGATISDWEEDEASATAYATAQNEFWICAGCATEFKSLFGWILELG